MKIKVVVVIGARGEILRIMGIGRRREISMSKIKKTTAIRKNRREKGSRAVLVGSNPHSKGDIFSRSISVFFARIIISVAKAAIITRASQNIIKVFRI
jgi:hypothetical protein